MKFKNDICLILPDKEEKLDGDLSKWINQFRLNLDNILKRQLKRNLNFTTIVPDAKTSVGFLDESAVVVILMDGSFVKQDGYRKLLDELSSKIETKKEIIIHEDRIIKVSISDSGLGLSARYLKYFANEEFIDRSTAEATVTLMPSDSITYWSRLLDLSSVINRVILDSSVPEESKLVSDLIFLADTTDEQELNRDVIRRELKQHGYQVEPEIDMRNITGETKAYLESLLSRAKVAVHIFGNEYGEIFGDSKVSLPEHQMNIVTEYIDKLEQENAAEAGNLIRLIWISPEVSPLDEKQIYLLNQIRQNIEKLMRTEIIQTPLELFKSILLKRLRQIREEGQRTETGFRADKKTVYIIHDKRDEAESDELFEKFSNAGMNAVKIDFQSGQANLFNLHKENLIHCDAALIIYGHNNRLWLSSKMKDLIKAPGFGRINPLSAKGLIVSGEDKLKDMKLPEDMMLLEKNEALVPFIEKLKQ